MPDPELTVLPLFKCFKARREKKDRTDLRKTLREHGRHNEVSSGIKPGIAEMKSRQQQVAGGGEMCISPEER